MFADSPSLASEATSSARMTFPNALRELAPKRHKCGQTTSRQASIRHELEENLTQRRSGCPALRLVLVNLQGTSRARRFSRSIFERSPSNRKKTCRDQQIITRLMFFIMLKAEKPGKTHDLAQQTLLPFTLALPEVGQRP